MGSEKPYEDAKISQLYTQFRPHYPEALYDTIISYCKDGGASFDTCLDLACGTGINTVPMLKYYKKVIGVDGSTSQIAQARATVPEVEFHVSLAENLTFLKDTSVDLITVATAFHWFPDRNKVYNEMTRVLKKNGVVAIFAYSEGKSPLSMELAELFAGPIKPFYPEAYVTLDTHRYNNITPPFSSIKRVSDLELAWPVTDEQFIGFARSHWPVQQYMLKHPASDKMEKFFSRISELCDGRVVQEILPLTLVMGRNE